MKRPWRRYAISLSLRLHIPVNQMLSQMDAAEIAEYSAFDMTKDPEWLVLNRQREQLEQSRNMTPEEKDAAFMAAMGKK